MKIVEIFQSIDGEVNNFHQGRLTTFVRTADCNLKCFYCFGILPGRHVPRIILSNNSNKKITEIKKGDKLLTFDEDKKLVETEVKEVLTREVDRWLRIKINNKLYFVTEEHPFFTTRGLIEAKELKIGDKIYHSTFNDKLSFRMIQNNPMKKKESNRKKIQSTNYKEIGKKISQCIQNKKENGEYQSPWNSMSFKKQQIVRKKQSLVKRGEKNSNWKGGKEQNYQFLKIRIKKSKIKRCSCCKKQTNLLDVHHKDENRINDSKENLQILCESCHYSAHQIGYNFWNKYRKDNKILIAQNGYKIQEIKLFDRSKYSPSIQPKPLKVYNFCCAPYNSYLVDYMWVHNCDTKYANQQVESRIEESPEEVFAKVESLGCRKVTITGGEPLLQKDIWKLIDLLRFDFYKISIETNGSCRIPIDYMLFANISWIIDYKLDYADQMIESNYIACQQKDWIKFVVQSIKELKIAINIKKRLVRLGCKASFAVSPVFIEKTEKGKVQDLVNYLIEKKEFDFVINLQLHKFVNLK